MDNTQGKVFNDFEPSATTDGSHKGMMKHVEATQKHFKMKLKQELTETNQRLKASKTKVKLLITGTAIQMQATIPLKPTDTHKQGRSSKQYKISLGIPANFDGLKTAEEEAYELGKLIARKTFVWTDKYLGVRATKDKSITFKEFYDQFEERYFQARKRTRKSENTFSGYIKVYKKYLISDLIISKENFIKLITSCAIPSSRNSIIKVSRLIAKSLEIKIDFTGLIVKYEKKQRYVPTDKEIIKYLDNFQQRYESTCKIRFSEKENWRVYKFIYGLIAVYGLRPREVINKPDLEWLISEDNKLNTFKVHADNKTGYREVVPFVPEWLELFDLMNEESLNLFRDKILIAKENYQLNKKVTIIAENFNRSGIPFTPYDLRHACAIRAHMQGVPIKAAADNLGHTVEIHTKVYQNWFGFDNRVKAFNQAFEEQSQLEKLEKENASLLHKLAEKELEVSRLRLIIQENKLRF